MVQDGVAEDEVEALVLERQRGRVAGGGLDLEAEPRGVRLERGEHAGGDVRAGGLADDARLQHVEAEVARARADLQRARERPRPGAEQLGQLADDLLLAVLRERDAPLGVVLARRHVVVALVDVEDLDLGRRGGHGAVSVGPEGEPTPHLGVWRRPRARVCDGAMTSRRPIALAVAAAATLAPAASAQAPQPTIAFDRPCYTAEQALAFTGTGYTPSGPVGLRVLRPRGAARRLHGRRRPVRRDRRAARRRGGHAARRRREPA